MKILSYDFLLSDPHGTIYETHHGTTYHEAIQAVHCASLHKYIVCVKTGCRYVLDQIVLVIRQLCLIQVDTNIGSI